MWIAPPEVRQLRALLRHRATAGQTRRLTSPDRRQAGDFEQLLLKRILTASLGGGQGEQSTRDRPCF